MEFRFPGRARDGCVQLRAPPELVSHLPRGRPNGRDDPFRGGGLEYHKENGEGVDGPELPFDCAQLLPLLQRTLPGPGSGPRPGLGHKPGPHRRLPGRGGADVPRHRPGCGGGVPALRLRRHSRAEHPRQPERAALRHLCSQDLRPRQDGAKAAPGPLEHRQGWERRLCRRALGVCAYKRRQPLGVPPVEALHCAENRGRRSLADRSVAPARHLSPLGA
mmetsp:Transcript_101142/g.321153  ORF Transcript_101142/g.321153 Transcript_101142/m.321153 type:complete len:219 (+) Transcript_101142:149-805(+)